MLKKLFINGKWKPGKSYFDLRSPYSGEVLASIPAATMEQVDNAINAAYCAKSIMAKLPSHKRAEILEKVTELLKKKQNEAATIIALEAAKPISFAKGEVLRTIETYKFAAEEAKRISGEMIPLDASASGENRIAYTVREPVGVVAAITPFNFPMNLVAHKLGPAIASGNAVVLKPASQTPLSSLFIAALFKEAGLPAGALNTITGKGNIIGDRIVTDERINMISFTGSPSVGIDIRNKAGLKRVTLEMGSNSALIIDKVADLDKVVRRCVAGAFSNQGQVCISLQRIYVGKGIFKTFLDSFVAETKKLTLGDPLDEKTDITALISSKETERVMHWIEEARLHGAIIACGGETENGVIRPTIIVNAKRDLRVSCQEVFGPVVIVNSVDTIEEAFEMVNDSRYGLQAGIYTDNIYTALEAADKLNVGGVMINDIPTFRVDHMPYGGVKASGMGREGIRYAIEEMTEMKLVVFNRN